MIKTGKRRGRISLRTVALAVARSLRQPGDGVKLKLAMRRKDAAYYRVERDPEVQTFPDDWFVTRG